MFPSCAIKKTRQFRIQMVKESREPNLINNSTKNKFKFPLIPRWFQLFFLLILSTIKAFIETHFIFSFFCCSKCGPRRDAELPERRPRRDGLVYVHSEQRRATVGEQANDAAGSLWVIHAFCALVERFFFLSVRGAGWCRPRFARTLAIPRFYNLTSWQFPFTPWISAPYMLLWPKRGIEIYFAFSPRNRSKLSFISRLRSGLKALSFARVIFAELIDFVSYIV